MKKKQKIQDLSNGEMQTQLRDMEDKLFRIKFQMSMGQLDGLKRARAMKKDKARMLTILRERELQGKTA